MSTDLVLPVLPAVTKRDGYAEALRDLVGHAIELFKSPSEDDRTQAVDEAAGIWQKDIGLAPDRIARMGEDDNFWPAGAPTNGPPIFRIR